jgi:cholest-4-en-3-one 26-monooxygenase
MTAATRPEAELNILDPDTYANGDPSTFGLPLDYFDYLRAEHPVFLQKLPEDPLLIDEVWLVTRHADILAMDRDPSTFTVEDGPINVWAFTMGGIFGKPGMLNFDGDRHRRQRRIVNRGFRPSSVQKWEAKFRQYARRIVDHVLEQGAFDFVEEVSHRMPALALGDVLGVPEDDRRQFFAWMDMLAAPFETRVTRSVEEMLQALNNLIEYCRSLMQLRLQEPSDDVMTQMALAGSEHNLSEDEVIGNALLLVAGAAESTRTAISHGMHSLLQYPDQMAWLRERADDIPPSAIQEMVRIATPFTHLVRAPTRDVEIHGNQIKRGERIAMLFVSANFDPDAITDPRRFDLGRDPNPHFSFGQGPHSCLGKHVAASEIKILFEELLRRTRDIEQTGDVAYVRDNYARGVYSLPVNLDAA